MTILLPALAATFAAFCIWLTVRIVNRKERWAKWTLAAVVGVPALYVASFGPVCRFADGLSADRVEWIYKPMIDVMLDGPEVPRDIILQYASICGGKDTALQWLLNGVAREAGREDERDSKNGRRRRRGFSNYKRR